MRAFKTLSALDVDNRNSTLAGVIGLILGATIVQVGVKTSYDLLRANSATDADISNAEVIVTVGNKDTCDILARLAQDSPTEIAYYFCMKTPGN